MEAQGYHFVADPVSSFQHWTVIQSGTMKKYSHLHRLIDGEEKSPTSKFLVSVLKNFQGGGFLPAFEA
jgi:hypothetical protein